MLRSKLLSAVLQSSASKGLVRGLAAHMPCTSSLASSSCSAVPSPHFGSVDTHHRASAVAVDDSSAPSLPLLASKPLLMVDLFTSSTVPPALARIAGDDEFSADAVDALNLTPSNLEPFMRRRLLDLMRHSIGQETDSPYNAISASATGFHNSSSLAGTQRAQQPLVRSLIGPQPQQTHASLVVGGVARAFSTGDEVDGVAATAEVVTTGGIAQQPPVTVRDKDNDNTQSRTLLLAFTC